MTSRRFRGDSCGVPTICMRVCVLITNSPLSKSCPNLLRLLFIDVFTKIANLWNSSICALLFAKILFFFYCAGKKINLADIQCLFV